MIQGQVRIILDRLDRTDRLIQLGVATIGAMIAIVGFLIAQSVRVHPTSAAGIAISILTVMISIYLLVRLNTSLHKDRSLDLGPDPMKFFEFIETEHSHESTYTYYLIRSLSDAIQDNEKLVRTISIRQGRAITWMAVGVIIHLTSIFFIVGGHIHG